MMSRRVLLSLALAALATGAIVWALFGFSDAAFADPEVGQSVDVAVIGSPEVINGGTLTTSGGGFDDFDFSNLAPAAVDETALGAFDTVVLNVASLEMNCDTATLSADAKTALVDFVSGGGKLIIYDSECPPNDYSWLPYPFTTANPGQMGGYGTATIVEENKLGSNDPNSPHYVDAASLGSVIDAIGDMNVMTTRDASWCLSMEGTNSAEQTGPVHVYSFYGDGLIIYNGMDVDYMGEEPSPPYPNGLEKVWLLELQQPLSGTGLACGHRVITPTPGVWHRKKTATPTEVPPTETPLAGPTVQPPLPPATPSGAAGPVIAPPSTGEGDSGHGNSDVWLWALSAATAVAGVGWLAHRRVRPR